MLAAMKFSVMADIPSIGTEANWGFMLGQFKWVYAFLSPIGGYIADRFSRRFTICGSLFVWSAVTWWTGHVTTYDELLLDALAHGHQRGVLHSGGAGADRRLPRRADALARGRAASDGHLLRRHRRRLQRLRGRQPEPRLAVRVRRLRRRRHALRGAAGASAARCAASPRDVRCAGSLRRPIARANCSTNGSFILLVLYFTLPALAGWVVRDWMPAILKEQFDIGQGKAGVSATLYWQVAAIVGAVVGGWLADRWMRRHERGRIFVSAIGMSLIVPAMFGVGNAGTLAVAIGVPHPVRPRLGLLRLQQHADPLPDRAARTARHRLRHHEPRQHQLRRLRRLGLRCAARPRVPLNVIFGAFAGAAILSVVLVLLIRPRPERVADGESR